MKKALLLLAIGVAAGYSLGFKDAQVHEQDLLERTVARLQHRGEAYNNDVDKTMDRLERR